MSSLGLDSYIRLLRKYQLQFEWFISIEQWVSHKFPQWDAVNYVGNAEYDNHKYPSNYQEQVMIAYGHISVDHYFVCHLIGWEVTWKCNNQVE
jgi:hypothetical protein